MHKELVNERSYKSSINCHSVANKSIDTALPRYPPTLTVLVFTQLESFSGN